jgi:hypothetical protein
VTSDCSGGGATFLTATAQDSCTSATVTCVDQNGQPIGNTAGPGTHQITCTATDGAGNQSSCGFTVVVEGSGGADIQWLWPLHEGQVFKFWSGQIIPIRVRGIGCDGQPVPSTVKGFVEVEYDSDGDGTYETEILEIPVGLGHFGGLMDRFRVRYYYNLLTWFYPWHTEDDGRSFRLTVRLFAPGPTLLVEEHIILESH